MGRAESIQTGRSGLGQSLKEATFVHVPSLSAVIAFARWQPKSKQQRENRKQLDFIADGLLLRDRGLWAVFETV